MCRAGEWVLLIREAFLLHRALFLSERARMKSVCSLPVPHALVEATGSSVCALSDVLCGWRGCEWGEKWGKYFKVEFFKAPAFLSSEGGLVVRPCTGGKILLTRRTHFNTATRIWMMKLKCNTEMKCQFVFYVSGGSVSCKSRQRSFCALTWNKVGWEKGSF